MTCKETLKLVEKYKLQTLSRVQLSDGQYICQKKDETVRSFWRKDRNSQSQPLTKDSQPTEGAEVFHFASVKLIYKGGKGKIERDQDISVPDLYLASAVGEHFLFTVRNGFANFKDEPVTTDQVEALMAETV